MIPQCNLLPIAQIIHNIYWWIELDVVHVLQPHILCQIFWQPGKIVSAYICVAIGLMWIFKWACPSLFCFSLWESCCYSRDYKMSSSMRAQNILVEVLSRECVIFLSIYPPPPPGNHTHFINFSCLLNVLYCLLPEIGVTRKCIRVQYAFTGVYSLPPSEVISWFCRDLFFLVLVGWIF